MRGEGEGGGKDESKMTKMFSLPSLILFYIMHHRLYIVCNLILHSPIYT